MKRIGPAHQKFLVSLYRARSARVSTARALWESRWAFLQWFLVFAIFAIFFVSVYGPEHASNMLAVAFGVMLGFLVQLRHSVRVWPWLAEVVDWAKVEKHLSDSSDEGQ